MAWRTRRAVKLHLTAAVVVPGCLALGWWQLTRALGGNTLSWAYTFEWPVFAGYATYMWWRLLHEEDAFPSAEAVPEPDPGPGREAALRPDAPPGGEAVPERHDREVERGRGVASPAAATAAPDPSCSLRTPGGPEAGVASGAPASGTATGRAEASAGPTGDEPEEATHGAEEDELAAYNRYLAALNASGRRKRW